MVPGLVIQPSPASLVLAAIAVALGAPLFSDGLHALRLRRRLARLRLEPLSPSSDGFTHARGIVRLESPLFSPLGGRPCAGYRLVIAGEGTAVRRVVDDHRDFRLLDGQVAARVAGNAGAWDMQVTATRRIGANEPLTENLRSLIGRVPEAAWLRRRGVALLLEERALLAGGECHVIGFAHPAAPAAAAEPEWARTGTDDAVAAVPAFHGPAGAGGPALALDGGEHLDFLRVFDREPEPPRLRIAPLRVVGLVLGPLLTLTGLLYLAAVADLLRAHGRL